MPGILTAMVGGMNGTAKFHLDGRLYIRDEDGLELGWMREWRRTPEAVAERVAECLAEGRKVSVGRVPAAHGGGVSVVEFTWQAE